MHTCYQFILRWLYKKYIDIGTDIDIDKGIDIDINIVIYEGMNISTYLGDFSEFLRALSHSKLN